MVVGLADVYFVLNTHQLKISNMSRNDKGILYSLWMGFGFGYLWKISLTDWRFWVYIVILVILVEIYANHKDK